LGELWGFGESGENAIILIGLFFNGTTNTGSGRGEGSDFRFENFDFQREGVRREGGASCPGVRGRVVNSVHRKLGNFSCFLGIFCRNPGYFYV